MVKPRRKAPAIAAPATIAEASLQLGRYQAIAAQIEEAKAIADASIATIEAERDAFVAPREQQLKEMFLQLRTWWAVAAPELTEGKRKSIELAGCIIGERTTPPALKLPKGMKVEIAVGFIQSIAETWAGAKDFLRTKVEIDKPPLIKLLGNSTAVGPMVERIREEGFRVEQKDEFFIDRAARKDADPVEVEQPVEVVS